MCLAIPMKIMSIEGSDGVVQAGGLKRRADLSFVRGVRVGDYVLIHAGFAIEKVNKREAEKTLSELRKLRL